MKTQETNWPNCSVPDCPYKSCRKLGSDKCWAHTHKEFHSNQSRNRK